MKKKNKEIKHNKLMRRTFKRKIFTALAAVCVCICTVMALYMSYSPVVNGVTLGETGLKEVYAVGTQLRIPVANLVVDGKGYNVQPTVYFPDGTAYQDKDITLNESGKYRLEYSLETNGKTYTETKYFNVFEYTASNLSTGQPLRYFSDENYAEKGLRFELKAAETVRYNKVIDISDATKNDVLLSVDATPSVVGAVVARDLFIRLTDAFDSENYITIRIRRAHERDNNQNFSYIMASYGEEELAGYGGADGTYLYTNGIFPDYGTGIANGLNGNWNLAGTSHIVLNYDYAENTLYLNGTQKIINFASDFEDSEFKGFTQGKVLISVWAEKFQSDISAIPFGGVFLDVYGENLAENVSEDGTVSLLNELETVAPEVDFGEYGSIENIPEAMVGFPYRIYDYNVFSLYGNEKSNVAVYYGYNSNTRYKLPIYDGAFIPEYDGMHTIVYSVTDRFGNYTETLVEVYARKNEGAHFNVNIDKEEYSDYTQGTVGIGVPIPGAEAVTYSGNLGNVKLDVSVKHSD